MFGIEILEVGIGLVFMYLVISSICSGIVEAGVKISKLRSKHLKTALGKLLDDPNYNGFVKQLYEHHLISSPLKDKLGDPTWLSSKKFAAAVFDILTSDTTEDERYKAVEAKIKTIKDDNVRTRLLNILKSSAEDLDSMKDKVESWFNDSMEAVTEWYRKRMRLFVTICSVIVVGSMNADTIYVAQQLWNDDELRAATVATSQSYAENYGERLADTTPVSEDSLLASLKNQLELVKGDINTAKTLPVGWNCEQLPGGIGYDGNSDPVIFWLVKILGLVFTIGAVSLGSTYWYATLKSLLNLRFGSSKSADPAATVAEKPVNVTINTGDPKSPTVTTPEGATVSTTNVEKPSTPAEDAPKDPPA